jgi:hypothetical protein
MTAFTLTLDQENARRKFVEFILDPERHTFVLKGYAGTGKSTLVNQLLSELPKLMRTVRLINPSVKTDYQVLLTATTNKAAEALQSAVNKEVTTIQSLLGLVVKKDFATGESKLVEGRNSQPVENSIVFIDEASYIDTALLRFIQRLTRNCKVVYIGDPAQLTPVKARGTVVFDGSWDGAELKEVVRQAQGNPILDLSEAFRNTVTHGEFFSFTPDGHHIQHLSRADFDDLVLKEFARPDWKHNDSRILAWTNKRVIAYNHGIWSHIKGYTNFQEGDYAICNQYVGNRTIRIKTDELVKITRIEPSTFMGMSGWDVQVNGVHSSFFLPRDLAEKDATIKRLQNAERLSDLATMEQTCIDLRAAYACTINKAQGSTYDKVFIDLDDIKRCTSGDQIARMLYVAVSRARFHVYFTGDLV